MVSVEIFSKRRGLLLVDMARGICLDSDVRGTRRELMVFPLFLFLFFLLLFLFLFVLVFFFFFCFNFIFKAQNKVCPVWLAAAP